MPTHKKYDSKKRKAPLVPAGEHKNKRKRGNDGNMWVSRPNVNRVYRWVKVTSDKKTPRKTPKKSTSKKRRTTSTSKKPRKTPKKSTSKKRKPSKKKTPRKTPKKASSSSSNKGCDKFLELIAKDQRSNTEVNISDSVINSCYEALKSKYKKKYSPDEILDALPSRFTSNKQLLSFVGKYLLDSSVVRKTADRIDELHDLAYDALEASPYASTLSDVAISYAAGLLMIKYPTKAKLTKAILSGKADKFAATKEARDAGKFKKMGIPHYGMERWVIMAIDSMKERHNYNPIKTLYKREWFDKIKYARK